VTPIIAVHGGAGGGGDPQVEGVRAALLSGVAVLGDGGSALDAACAAVNALEADGRFNAGRGAVPTSTGGIELDAAVMTGHDRAAAAVAGLTVAAHPIGVARSLLTVGGAVFLAGAGADAFVFENGLDVAPSDWFVTPATASPAGTVGAVALDGQGRLAAATSTGGVRRQAPGRVGDTPVIGAGTYADERCAISATGAGEAFIRAVFAHSIAVAVRDGASLADACAAALTDVGTLGGSGGCVAIDGDGTVVLPHTTKVMPAGWATSAADLHLQLANTA
jgi:isoaspartyl peptidase/L-asparaginase-like protein (Ntn-hydrolase superfamily)